MNVNDRRFTQTEMGLIMKLEMIQTHFLRDMAKLHNWKYSEYVGFLADVFLSRTFYSAKNDPKMYRNWNDVFLDKELVKQAAQEVLDDYKSLKNERNGKYARIN